MKYSLFSYPNCMRCEELRKYLLETSIDGEEYNLTLKEAKLKIREFLGLIKRDSKGAIIIPTLVLEEKGEAVTVLNNPKELEDWLRSKA